MRNNFTTKNDMPWPQYYDGKHWKNDISTRFGIAGIPAMFLIDQQGKIVTTEARGEKLEAEVKRLLGLWQGRFQPTSEAAPPDKVRP